LKRIYRSFTLAALGIVMIALYLVKDLPLWVLLLGIFSAGVAYAPHRTVAHSLFSCAYVSWIVYLIEPSLVTAVIVGYLSHLLADTLTSAGVPYLWPYKKKFNLRPIGMKIKSGGKEDQLIGSLALLLASLGFVYLIGLIFYNEAMVAGWF
jgi:inner membrane protein